MKNKGFFFTLLVFVFFFLVLISVVSFIRTQQMREKITAEKIRIDSLESFSDAIKIGAGRAAYLSGYNAIKTAATYVATNNNKNFLNNSKCLWNSCIFELMFNASLEKNPSYIDFNLGTVWFNALDQMGNATLKNWIEQLNATAIKTNIKMNFSISDVAVYQTDPWNVRISCLIYVSMNDISKESIVRFETIPVNVVIPIEGFEEPNYSLYSTGSVRRYIKKYPDSSYALASRIGVSQYNSSLNWSYARVNKAQAPECTDLSAMDKGTILLVKNSSNITNSTSFCQSINSFQGFIFQDDYCYFNTICNQSILASAYNFTTPLYDLIPNGTYVLLSGGEREVWNISKFLEAYSTGYFFEANFAPSYLMRLSGNYNQSIYGIESFITNLTVDSYTNVSNIDYIYFNKTPLFRYQRCRIRGAKNCENYTICSNNNLPHFWIDAYSANKSTGPYPISHAGFYGLGYGGLTYNYEGNPCFANKWTARNTITIDNTLNPNTLTNYQISITLDTATLISLGEMNLDCSDIRFTDSTSFDAVDPGYPYWIESDSCNSPSTRIWVKVDSIQQSATKTIYVYYGNPSAARMSSGDNTFIEYESFEGTTDWTYAENETINTYSGVVSSGWWSADGSHSYYISQIDSVPGWNVISTWGEIYKSITFPSASKFVFSAERLDAAVGVDNEFLIRVMQDSTILWSQNIRPFQVFLGQTLDIPAGTYTMRLRLYRNQVSWANTDAYSYWDKIYVRNYSSPEPTTSVS